MIFTNQALKFKYQPGHIKLKGHQFQSVDEIWNAGKNAKHG